MAGLLVTNRKNGHTTHDPFALARELFSFAPRPELASRQSGFAPRFNVKESGEAFTLEADLPGVSREAVEITLEKDRLTIAGSRTAAEKKEGESYHLHERTSGSFSRTFVLPANVDGESITADLADGVLTVTVPKKAEAKPRTIQINAGK